MPTPRPGESKKDFISRCIPYVMKEDPKSTPDHAAAKCYGIWEQHKKKGAKEEPSTRPPQSDKIMRDQEMKFFRKSKEAETFNCECIKCGHKMKTEKHCADIKCPKCGGQMRRAERPGPGRE